MTMSALTTGPSVHLFTRQLSTLSDNFETNMGYLSFRSNIIGLGGGGGQLYSMHRISPFFAGESH